ncbi:hypothetical protein L1987_61637 [Smallanthus sonchifolius]|uniref:Uncharacterized protein n=1 Tax=Smallanthus sonchifolius TaxID=185202 RepID=A0ACB9C8H0_9ASTR|nr:hypothetical protein L1987_61637 [Smallanthus sonchifolius]
MEGSEFGDPSSSPYIPSLADNQNKFEDIIGNDGSEVRAPLPVKRDVLYDAFYSFDEELEGPGVWEADQGSTSESITSGDNLASLYQPPFALMYHGSFEKAKEAAKDKDRWLIVNVQSTREFSSHMLNRDTWGDETVAQTITSNFIFWQICDYTEEGSKITTYYKLDSVPATLVIDPVTDETNKDDDKMKLAQALSMLTMKSVVLLKDSGAIKDVPKKEKLSYPALPEEPKGDKSLLCRLLWSFYAAKCGDEKPFKLTHAIPGAVKDMDCDSLLTFDESGVANSMISVTWE